MPTAPMVMSPMPMTGESWLGAAAAFIGMWLVMMAAMMLPSLVPELLRYREAVGRTGGVRPGRLTALAGAGYFTVWTVVGLAVFPLGIAVGALVTRHPTLKGAAPIAAGVVISIAGVLQFTAWKARHLASCRAVPGLERKLRASSGAAWRHGLLHGVHCVSGCAGLTAILLVLGVMDLRAMTVVAAAITAERLAPAGERVARIIGVAAILAGLVVVARAMMIA
jgi:predicted metal-binding membrane protein